MERVSHSKTKNHKQKLVENIECETETQQTMRNFEEKTTKQPRHDVGNARKKNQRKRSTEPRTARNATIQNECVLVKYDTLCGMCLCVCVVATRPQNASIDRLKHYSQLDLHKVNAYHANRYGLYGYIGRNIHRLRNENPQLL